MIPINVVPIADRMLIRDRTLNVVSRIVAVDNVTQQAWLVRIDDDSWPRPMPMHRLQEELDPENGHFSIETEEPNAHFPVLAEAEHESATDERHKNRYALIEPLTTGDNIRLLLSKRTCKKLIDQRLKEVKSTRQTLSSLIKLYFKRGMTFEALRPDYANCGGSGQRRNTVDGEKIGAPRIITPGTGIGVNDELRRIFRIGADFYLSRKKPTLKEARDHIVRHYFSRPVKNDKGQVIRFEVEKDAKPTERQLGYYISTNFPNRYIRRRRDGDKNWNLNERELLGAADGDVQGPGDLFQVDATVADVYLVSQFDRRRIVGRPILYFVVDVFSRLIVGIYVGFEGPSWIGAMMAIVNTVTPKVEFCRHYDIDIDESDWPSHFAPKRLGADRGELMSVELGKNITRSLGIEIENASPGRPDLKALVERRFGIVPTKFKQYTPGYVKKDFNERGAEDYRLNASADLREFTQLVIYAVLEHNFTPIRGICLPADMVTDELTTAPIDIWQWGVANRSGYLKTLTVEEVALNVMPPGTARVTPHGIRFKGGFYSCATAIRDDWFAKARRHERPVAVSFDPRRMEYLYLRDPKLPNGFEACSLLDKSSGYSGKSLFEIEELKFAQKRIEAAGEDDRQEKRIFFDEKMAEIQKKAKKATKAVADPNTPKSRKVAGIRDNRAEEKEIQRGAEGFDLEGPMDTDTNTNLPDKPAVSPGSAKRLANDLALLEEKRREREGG